MRIKTKLGAVVGAVALALSANTFANTSADSAGTLWLSIDDATTSSEYFLDTGISVLSFNSSSSLANPISLAGSNFSTFLSTVTGGNLSTTSDNVTFSVIGAASTGTPQTRSVDFTSAAPPAGPGPNGAASIGNIASGFGQIRTFLSVMANPSGTSETFNSQSTGVQWLAGGNSAQFDSFLSAINGGSVKSALAFYQATETQGAPDTTVPGSLATLAGTWSLDLTAQTLSYTASSPVPLPAPLLLLLSGLGAMGIVGRRNRATA
jgi:hypothetical protein